MDNQYSSMEIAGTLVGTATVTSRTPGVVMLEDRNDPRVLWGIRVDPIYQQCGVGRTLFEAAAGWCRDEGLVQLKIKTQDVNVPAFMFYERMGCDLKGLDADPYRKTHPHEFQFL